MPPTKKRPISKPQEGTNDHYQKTELVRSALTRPDEVPLLLRRPGFDTLIDNKYKALIAAASVINASGTERLRLEAEFFNTEGESLVESFLLQPDWKEGSSFRQLLEVTDLLPKPKEALDVNGLVGRELLLTIKINTKNGRSFTNLVQTELIPDEFDTDSEDTYTDESGDEDQYE
ncbi:hypothetical protein SAMN04487895_11481 [Paenibacillus sophorae]|uniref:Uncharacterized protein n=1 Tax=Paenibacillus sophorae TaxID=1333845 RepID=A0A1H8TK01_9BACL|nr:hypothetical protein [Paenibacillus sophorae]QWU16239.1 hypothetical protein KP014_02910 [Paenibacillus sophorae]SEO90903.1 hypothetical protein SAMN04487895_11481 [Paenibacillus sophorae]